MENKEEIQGRPVRLMQKGSGRSFLIAVEDSDNTGKESSQ